MEMPLGISKQPVLKAGGEKLRALLPFCAQLQDGRDSPGAGIEPGLVYKSIPILVGITFSGK